MDIKKSLTTLFPVMFGFFIMGFVDVVSIATNYVKSDFTFNDTVSSLISVSCFIWFLFLSIPTGLFMNRYGRKFVVLMSFIVSVIALVVPLISYNFVTILIAFALIGIGNTLLQVSLNPLVTDVVSPDRLTATLTTGQFLKAVCSFIGPLIAAAFAGSIIGWKGIFIVYAVISAIAFVWLWLSPTENRKSEDADAVSFGRVFALLKDKTVLFFFLGILVLVGADIGMSVTFPKVLSERLGWDVDKAVMGNTVYFLCKSIGAFLGALLLLKIKEHVFYNISIVTVLVGLLGMIFVHSSWLLLVCVALFGLGYANLFSIIFGLTLNHVPERANEASSLLITGVAGGAIFTPILGAVSDGFGGQTAAVVALAILWIYMLGIAPLLNRVAKGK